MVYNTANANSVTPGYYYFSGTNGTGSWVRLNNDVYKDANGNITSVLTPAFGNINNVVALGNEAASSNTANQVIAIGDQSAKGNTGTEVIALGRRAVLNNKVPFSIAFGKNASEGTTSTGDVGLLAIGYWDAQGAEIKTKIIAIGTQAMQDAKGNTRHTIAIGFDAGRDLI